MSLRSGPATPGGRESASETPYAWFRLCVSLLITTIGGVGLWSVAVVMPTVQAEFGVARADAAFPFTLLMIGFAAGGIIMGRLTDRFGIALPLGIGAFAIAGGYLLAAKAETLWQFALVHGVLIGFLGSSATFGPVIADASRWFTHHRGIAVAIASSGSYVAGTVWPPVIQSFVQSVGWRETHMGIGIFCLLTILPLAALLRRTPPEGKSAETASSADAAVDPARGVSPGTLQALLVLAGVTCCMAMAMPQVHIVSLCADLGYGTARGAQMLSVMLAAGIISRLGFGWVADRIGPLPTFLLCSTLQALSLLLFLPSKTLPSLFMISALFGLAQGGIVPTYATIIRTYFPAAEAGTRIGLVLSATLVGMALGGWMSGGIYDLTLSYDLAFLNGFFWNLLNIMIALWLFFRLTRRAPFAVGAL
jgi:MFS family permease